MKSFVKFSVAGVCLLSAAAALAVDAGKSVKVDGWISDSMCGASHASVSGANPGCVAKCIREGSKPVFVEDSGKKVWTIDNPDAIKEHYGHHVQVTATEDADKKQVHITGVTMLAEQGAKTDTMMK